MSTDPAVVATRRNAQHTVSDMPSIESPRTRIRTRHRSSDANAQSVVHASTMEKGVRRPSKEWVNPSTGIRIREGNKLK